MLIPMKKNQSNNVIGPVNVSVNNVREMIEERLKSTHIMNVKTGKEIKLNNNKKPNKSMQNKKVENKNNLKMI